MIALCGWHRNAPYKLLNSYSASHDNWCTATLWNRIMTAQCEGMGKVGSARYIDIQPSLSCNDTCHSSPLLPHIASEQSGCLQINNVKVLCWKKVVHPDFEGVLTRPSWDTLMKANKQETSLLWSGFYVYVHDEIEIQYISTVILDNMYELLFDLHFFSW